MRQRDFMKVETTVDGTTMPTASPWSILLWWAIGWRRSGRGLPEMGERRNVLEAVLMMPSEP